MFGNKTKLVILLAGIFVLTSLFSLFGGPLYKKFFLDNKCANSLSCEESLEFSVKNDELAIYNEKSFHPPSIDTSELSEKISVLGMETAPQDSTKRIEVDLTTQTLKAYEGDELFMESKVSTGKLFPTPTGEFTIWRKIRATLMSGGSGSGYYYLPNVPYVMFFSNSEIAAGRGFSLHGTYWHNNFGHPMSHGCVNMKTREAKKLYEWADPQTAEDQRQSKPGELGTKIIIYGEAP